MSWRDTPETYLYTYLEAYEKTNCLFWCTDTRVATAVGTRSVKKPMAEQIHVCCEGYIEEESNGGNGIHCKPHCTPPCVNSYCKSPGVCACNSGYIPDVLEPHKCVPLCLKGCDHGTCIAPNICDCDEGYQSLAGVCVPVCSDPCTNGSCVAPETCQCLPGYKRSDNGTCEPYCSSYTANGECINTITCEPGWVKVTKDSIETCEPVCTEPCVNGTCIAPETCDCSIGYIKSSLGCQPYCSYCFYGSCIGPETCVCNPGWFKKELNGDCLPHCDHSCGNGTCIAPNVCECFTGYEFDESRLLQDDVKGSLCVPLCIGCEGTCISPGQCTCVWPQVAVKVFDSPCGCAEDCSSTEDKCEKTVCVLASTTTTENIQPVEETTVFSTQEYVENDNLAPLGNDFYEQKVEKAGFNSKWMYGVVAVVLSSTIIVTLAVILKRKYCKTFQSNVLDPNDEVSTTVHYKQTSSS
ncbi:uncharacterized protein LOC142973457 [Anticarsia gemmatalis]|uniref:uncharacterized protein LOC142973457 n=1 Tax=Anticarsia gemmatalis TaxID=129554 RepID=UPI003F762BDD